MQSLKPFFWSTRESNFLIPNLTANLSDSINEIVLEEITPEMGLFGAK